MSRKPTTGCVLVGDRRRRVARHDRAEDAAAHAGRAPSKRGRPSSGTGSQDAALESHWRWLKRTAGGRRRALRAGCPSRLAVEADRPERRAAPAAERLAEPVLGRPDAHAPGPVGDPQRARRDARVRRRGRPRSALAAAAVAVGRRTERRGDREADGPAPAPRGLLLVHDGHATHPASWVAMAKTTVEMTADRDTVRPGESVTVRVTVGEVDARVRSAEARLRYENTFEHETTDSDGDRTTRTGRARSCSTPSRCSVARPLSRHLRGRAPRAR